MLAIKKKASKNFTLRHILSSIDSAFGIVGGGFVVGGSHLVLCPALIIVGQNL